MSRRTIERRSGRTALAGKDFHLAEEIDYIQRCAAEHDGRFVTVGPLALFSTETGDAWLLDPADHLAARIARDGDPEEIYFEESDTALPSAGKAITKLPAKPSSSATVIPLESPLSSAIQPTTLLSWADRKISNIFG